MLNEKNDYPLNNNEFIPRKIHYCWFGGGPFSELHNRCMASWKRYASDFEIIRWDETNCDMHENPFVEHVYKEKAWAFVADYFRFKALAAHGGIYLDTDTELHQPLDSLLTHKAFFAFEGRDQVNAAIIGVVPGHPLVKEMMNLYQGDAFRNKNGNIIPASIPYTVTRILLNYGLKPNGKKQILDGNIAVYPANVLTFDARDGECIAEHYYEFSWFDERYHGPSGKGGKPKVSTAHFVMKEYFKMLDKQENKISRRLLRAANRLLKKLRLDKFVKSTKIYKNLHKGV